MNGFLLGVLIGCCLVTAEVVWAFRRRSDLFVVDRYWLENADRWASLRGILIEESAAVCGVERNPE